MKSTPTIDRQPLASWLRTGDRIVLERAKKLLDPNVWTIVELHGQPQPTPSGNYQRMLLRFKCNRYGIIENPLWLDKVRG